MKTNKEMTEIFVKNPYYKTLWNFIDEAREEIAELKSNEKYYGQVAREKDQVIFNQDEEITKLQDQLEREKAVIDRVLKWDVNQEADYYDVVDLLKEHVDARETQKARGV